MKIDGQKLVESLRQELNFLSSEMRKSEDNNEPVRLYRNMKAKSSGIKIAISMIESGDYKIKESPTQ